MKFTVLYGTESGNSELIAEDIATELNSAHEAEVFDLQNFDPANLSTDSYYIVVCSTHGDGELPNTAIDFYDKLVALAPDLTGIRYAMFGLGDTFYETYSQGSEIIDRKFTELGAERLGEYGRHDASSWDLGTDLALEWLPGVVDAFASVKVS